MEHSRVPKLPPLDKIGDRFYFDSIPISPIFISETWKRTLYLS